MLLRARALGPWIAAAGLVAWVLRHASLGDYRHDAGPSIDALAGGHVGTFLELQPLMGSVSLLLRAPFVAIADAFGSSDISKYEVGVAACLVAAAVLGVLVARDMVARGQSRWSAGAVLVLCVANPMTLVAVRFGHPEEVLGGVLCVGAVLLASGRRPVAAGIVLGLALATKQWALLAIAPVLLAAPAGRWRIALAGGVVAGGLTVPFLLASPDEFVATHRALASGIPVKGAVNIWWPFSSVTPRTVFDGVEWVTVEVRRGPALAGMSHQLIVLAALPLAALHWLRRRRLEPIDALGLLAVLLLLRCFLDPINNGYYHVPFLIALACYEGRRRHGQLPVLSLLAASLLWITFERLLPTYHAGVEVNTFYLAWTIPFCVVLLLWQLRVELPRWRRAPAVARRAAAAGQRAGS